MCAHPEKATGLMKDGQPVIEGHLKEKKGKWKIFKRWKTRHFTLSGANITYSKKDVSVCIYSSQFACCQAVTNSCNFVVFLQRKASLPVTKIQSVKTIRKGARDIPKAFEIFTNEQTYVFKAKDTEHAQKWVECLQIAVARTQSSRDQVTDFDLQTWDVNRVHKLRASARSSQLTQERDADRADARKRSDATAATTADAASPSQHSTSTQHATSTQHPPTTDAKPEASHAKTELSKSSAERQSVRRRPDSKATMRPSTDDACKKTSEHDENTIKDTNSNELDGGSTRASRRRKKSQTKL